MRNILNDVIKFINSADEDRKKKKWLKFILKTLLALLIGSSMVCFVFWIMSIIFRHLDEIILIVGGLGCCIALIKSMLPKKEQKQEQPVQESSTILQYDPITLENTYKIVRAGICYVVGEIYEIIGVRKPASYSQMDAPTHYSIVSNVPIYHLLVAKVGKDMDTYTVMGILQNTIEQKLNNNEFNGISQAVFFYNGQAYPSIMVDKVLDCGNMLRIDIAIASEYYCKYREQRIYNNMNGSDKGNFNDKDF